MGIYDRVKIAAERKGISINKMEKDLHLPRGSASKFNKNQPSAIRIAEIAGYLNTTSQFLLGETDDPSTLLDRIIVFKNEEAAKTARTILTDRNSRHTKIPVLGSIAAGIPIEMIEDIIDFEEIDEKLAASGTYFGLRIKGHSMEPRMLDGDIVIVRSQPDADSGDTVIVSVNGNDATCKRIRKLKDGIELIPNNPSYESLFFNNNEIEEMPVKIIGKVVELRGKY